MLFSLLLHSTECECSQAFRGCLKKLENDHHAKDVGNAYFSTGLFQCFTLAKPIIDCLEWKG